MKKPIRFLPAMSLLFGICLLGGCQAVFTFCPVSFLQRPASVLAPEQQVSHAQDALASGDQTAMKAAYDSLAATIAAGSTDATVLYTAASLGLELSGAPAVLTAAISSLAAGTVPDISVATLQSIDPQLLMASATYLQDTLAAAAAAGTTPELTAVDYVLGGVGIILRQADGNVDNVATLSAAQITTATDFVTQGIATLGLPAGDPVAGILAQFSGIIQNL